MNRHFILPIAFCFIASTLNAQTNVRPPHNRSISLDAILSCLNDPLLEDIFKTDRSTMNRLDSMGMTIMSFDSKKMADPDFLGLQSKMFYTKSAGESEYDILPTEILENGKIRIIGDSKLAFCHQNLSAHFPSKDDLHALPVFIEINVEGWSLNANEVFAHADQFKFRSGVFENSSNVYLVASKGRIDIQFLCKSDGLKFYRAIFFHPEEMSSRLVRP